MVNVAGVAGDQLKSFIERIERLEEEKTNIAADIREVFAEAKGTGFDIKAMRGVLKLRKMEAAEREEQEHMLDLYRRVLGLLPDLDGEESSESSEPSLAQEIAAA